MYKEFNMDSLVKVKLTLEGKYFLCRCEFLGQKINGTHIFVTEDEDGYIRLRFWEFIKIFGGFIEEPYKNYFFEDSILIDNEIDENQIKKYYKQKN